MATVVLDMTMSGRGVDAVDEMLGTTGAVVMGRRTFDLGDPENDWVADPPFEVPMFVPAHDIPDRVAEGAAATLTFVTEGVDGAVEGRGQLAPASRCSSPAPPGSSSSPSGSPRRPASLI
jgi:hypothetical protein